MDLILILIQILDLDLDLDLAGFGLLWVGFGLILVGFGSSWLGFWSITAFIARIALQEVLGCSKWNRRSSK